MGYDTRKNVEEHPITGARQVLQIGVAEMVQDRQRIAALLLDAAGIDLRDVVAHRVIGRRVGRVNEAETRGAAFRELTQITVEPPRREELRDRRQQRVGRGIRCDLEELRNGPTVVLAGDVEDGRSPASLSLEVDGEPHVAGPGVLVIEGGGTHHLVFLAVGEDDENIVAQWWPGHVRPNGLERRHNARAVIARARAGVAGVVMRVERDRAGGVRTWYSHHDSVDQAGAEAFVPALGREHDRSCLDLWVQPERPKLLNEVVSGGDIPGRSQRTWLAGDHPEVVHRTRRRELAGRRRFRHDRRGRELS
jgi:hypothetical protein